MMRRMGVGWYGRDRSKDMVVGYGGMVWYGTTTIPYHHMAPLLLGECEAKEEQRSLFRLSAVCVKIKNTSSTNEHREICRQQPPF